jgi:hypothetical protein
VAIWTHDFGIMVGRVRISAEKIGPREGPDVRKHGLARTVYETGARPSGP